MAIQRKYQRKNYSWWGLRDVYATSQIQAASCDQLNLEERYGCCGVHAGCKGIVLEKVNRGLIVQFNDGNMYAHLKCRYCDLDLVEGE